MPNFGYITVAAAVPATRVADVQYNVEEIERIIEEAEKRGVELLVFPELCITGYTCQDLFRSVHLLDASDEALTILTDFSLGRGITFVVGAPHRQDDRLMNTAVIISNGQRHYVHKTFLPNYNEFYEKRWFSVEAVDAEPRIFRLPSGVTFGVEICEDLWSAIPPSSKLATSGADIILNLSATDELIGKHAYLRSLLAQQSARTMSGYVYSSCGFGESTQDVVYGGNAIICENGSVIAKGQRFAMSEQLVTAQIDIEKLRGDRRSNTTFTNAQRRMATEKINIIDMHSACQRDFVLEREIDPTPFIPKSGEMKEKCDEILNIQAMGLVKRLTHTSCKRVVVGISGGLDSTLALLVCVHAFDKMQLPRKGIIGVTMPGFGTSDRTHTNAVALMESLGVTMYEIPIAKSVEQHFKDIGHDASVHDVVYENSQARERTQILMDLSNKFGAMVIGTGDLSELALGWATYNGDHMSMYAVNASVPKTLIRYLVEHFAEVTDNASAHILRDIINTPISPELLPADEDGNIQQKTEDLVGPYELHDFFLYHFLRHGFRPKKIFLMAQKAFAGKFADEVITHWLSTFCRRFFSQQFKRSCLPDGPKVGSVSLSPRGDWRMPSDAASTMWLNDIG